MEALDLRATHLPALVQIGGQSETNLVRHVLDSRKARFDRWRDAVRSAQAAVRSGCERGIGCTVTEPFQPDLFEGAAS